MANRLNIYARHATERTKALRLTFRAQRVADAAENKFCCIIKCNTFVAPNPK